MPRLLRLRMVSVGHPNARMQDLTLDFRDPDGRPTDSTIWLRNGGGKSSILNLFFALVRTGRREFLGGKADSRRRSLDDYILLNDRGVVAAEWELDVAADTLEFAKEPGRLITGVFYERSSSGRDGLRRLFFATRVAPEYPRSGLEGLPINVEGEEGNRARRTLAAFKQVWTELREEAPHLQTTSTEIQNEWHTRLNEFGLDPDLFIYQLRMNLREGGADELFRFASAEHFIDFLLELTVDDSRGAAVSKNLETYRKQLQRRKHELVPDLDLSTGLLDGLEPLAELATRRRRIHDQVAFASARLFKLEEAAEERIAQLEADAERLAEHLRLERLKADEMQALSRGESRKVAALNFHAARKRYEHVQRELAQAREGEQLARRGLLTWRAALPMRDALLHEGEAKAYRQQLQERRVEHAPMLEQLKQSAQSYAGALLHQAQELRQRQSLRKEELAAAQDEVRRVENAAGEQERLAAVAEVELRGLEANLKRVDEKRQRLVKSNAMQEAEDGLAAEQRLVAELDALNARRLQLLEEREAANEREAEFGERMQESHRELAEARTLLLQLERAHEQAEKERLELEAEATLLRVLEVTHVDADSLGDEVPALLEKRSAEQQELVARLRVERASLERSRLHLRENGLLPPSGPVEQVLGVLRGRVAASSGWSYIAENFKPTQGIREQLVEAYPEIAQGVVVNRADFERACELVEAAKLQLELPVLLVSPEALNLQGGPRRAYQRAVFGPSSHAHFDRAAGQEALVSLEERLEAIDKRVSGALAEYEALSRLVSLLRHFRTRFPRGWFGRQQQELNAAKARVDQAGERLAVLEEERSLALSKRRHLEADLEQAQAAYHNLEQHLERVRLFVDEYEGQTKSWQEALADRLGQRDALRERAVALNEEAERRRLKIRALMESLEPLAEEARLLESRAQHVGYLEASPEPKAGMVDELEAQYKRLREIYEGEVGSDELARLAEHHEGLAQRAWSEVDRQLREGVAREDVRAALDGLENPNDFELVLSDAEERLQESQAVVFEHDYELRIARKERGETERRWESLGRPEVDDPTMSAGKALELADAAEAESARFLRQYQIHLDAAQEGERRVLDRRQQAIGLRKDLERLLSVARSYRDLLPKKSEVEDLPLESMNLTVEIDRIEQILSRIRDELEELNMRRKEAVHELRRWATDPRFDELHFEIAQRFRTLDAESLELGAHQYRDALALRVREIRQALEDIERHRALLVKLVLSIAEEGLRQLKLADRASRLPVGVPEIGGTQFLRISSKEPAAPTARLELMGQLVDELIDEEHFPSGVVLVQRAVRQLARPFRVRVLNPDPAAAQRYIPISDTARFSGGEQLTSAILLYCTLANVRARTRGELRQPSSVLVLDNPIGRASRVRFLEMQRQFARAMGIQLVYTTAVNDHEALSILPNVIRLRNERIDRNRSHRLVELDTLILGTLESARIAKRELGQAHEHYDDFSEAEEEVAQE